MIMSLSYPSPLDHVVSHVLHGGLHAARMNLALGIRLKRILVHDLLLEVENESRHELIARSCVYGLYAEMKTHTWEYFYVIN